MTILKKAKAVILNDTSHHNHHGCRVVMGNLSTALQAHGFDILATAGVGTEWHANAVFVDALKKCDAVIINGEGTIHNGRPNAERLLKIINHKEAQNKKIYLINALYERNPPEWKRYLDRMDIVALRDHKSWSVCHGELGIVNAIETSDLSLFNPVDIKNNADKNYPIAIGDSILKDRRRELLGFYKINRQENMCYLPITTSIKYRNNGQLTWIQKVSQKRFALKTIFRRFWIQGSEYYPDSDSFLYALAHKRLYVTGRFHGVCLALKTRTPFVCVASNSSKIESLLKTIGLRDRIVDTIDKDTILGRDWSYTEDELAKIESFLQNAQEQWSSLFKTMQTITQTKA